MKRLRCPVCGNEVFFDSLACVRCGTGLAIELDRTRDRPIEPVDVRTTTACARRVTWACNWRAVGPTAPLCESCVLVDDGGWAGAAPMRSLQVAQRRALSQLEVLGVPWGGADGPRFSYRSSSGGDDAVIGHRSGEITLDLDEGDPAHRERVRLQLGEPYRTPLGHIRHELGHAVWQNLVDPDPALLSEFRDLLGDERADYATALADHYAGDDVGDWHDAYVSHYATAHPWEDFAECWAQLMHVHDVVETGAEWGVVGAPADGGDVDGWLTTSITATLVANELARAMGSDDLYPFTMSPAVRRKVAFCWRLTRLGVR